MRRQDAEPGGMNQLSRRSQSRLALVSAQAVDLTGNILPDHTPHVDHWHASGMRKIHADVLCSDKLAGAPQGLSVMILEQHLML